MTVVCLPGQSRPVAALRKHATNCFNLPPNRLVTPRRLDLAVKYRLFAHLSGGDVPPNTLDLYFRHIKERVQHRWAQGLPMDRWKRELRHYGQGAINLHHSMRVMGYDKTRPIDIDMDGEIFGGAHRIACAIALGIKEIPVVEHTKQRVTAPAWGADWFRHHGFDDRDVESLVAELEQMKQPA